ncbi:galactonate dehydratase [Acidianus manzaensis]|uniref:Galactonate dehydratase n=1 Tax=Acidianus manzaensis TaxID=282676 RepID=A0A1W6JYU4_9CREN|nr:galactonate dehydratase [Acidianus manzaensis]ARM75443.1 galactonate dehydratase [Acidianus manzaensis]
MKITDVKVYLVNAVWRNFTIVKIDTDDGISGYGEGTMGDFEKTIEAAVYDFKPFLIGREVNPNEIYNFLYRHFFWRGGPILMSAISAIEQALWDILGKSVNKPVYELLGGKTKDSVRVYANGFISGDRSPEEFANAVRKVVDQGFNAVKLDPFGSSGPQASRDDIEKAKSRLKAIRDAVGYNIDVMLDAHGRFNTASAVKMINEISKYEPYWVEEPVPEEDIEALKNVKDKSPITIASGERIVNKYRYREFLEKRAVDIIQPDVCHVGGIEALKEVGNMAETYYISVAPHNPNGPIATAATLNLMLILNNSLIMEYWIDAETVRRSLIKEYFNVKNSYIHPSDKPGLGIEVNEEALSRYPYKKLHLEYFSKDYKYYGDINPNVS